MRQHESPVRRNRQRSLRGVLVAATCVLLLALMQPARSDLAVQIALRLTPGRYERTEKLVHLITYQMSKALKKLAGSRADDHTILEDRTRLLTIKAEGAISETESNTRRFGGDQPKDKSVKERTVQYDGSIASDGIRKPVRDVLEDAGDGALDQLPDIPLAPGQTWSFSREVRTDRELGQGPMTYVDKVVRVEERNGHRIAIIAVSGSGRIAPAADLQSHGFKTATMDFAGTAEFDTTSGLPGVQHYTGKVTWATKVMFARIGVVFNDTYDASAFQPTSVPARTNARPPHP